MGPPAENMTPSFKPPCALCTRVHPGDTVQSIPASASNMRSLSNISLRSSGLRFG